MQISILEAESEDRRLGLLAQVLDLLSHKKFLSHTFSTHTIFVVKVTKIANTIIQTESAYKR